MKFFAIIAIVIAVNLSAVGVAALTGWDPDSVTKAIYAGVAGLLLGLLLEEKEQNR